MKIGLMLTTEGESRSGIDAVIAFAQMAEAMNFDNLWMAQIFGLDAINVLSLAGRETSRITLGTAVTPTRSWSVSPPSSAPMA